MSVHLRPSQALRLWQAASLGEVTGGHPDLSMRQMSILLTVYLDPPPHTVRGLAGRLRVTKPVITRALNRLGEIGLLARHRDKTDGRNVLIGRTLQGALFVERFGDRVIAAGRALPA